MHGDRQVYGKSEGGKAFCIAGFMKKLFIFDLDGTLVNSIYDLGDAMNAVLERYGFPVFDYDTYKHLVGNGTLKLVERALPEKLRSEDVIALFFYSNTIVVDIINLSFEFCQFMIMCGE